MTQLHHRSVAYLVVEHLPGEGKARAACYTSSASRRNEDTQVLKHGRHKSALSFLGAIIFK